MGQVVLAVFGGYAEAWDGPAFEFAYSTGSCPSVRLPTAGVRRASSRLRPSG